MSVIVTTTTFYTDPMGKDRVRFDLARELTQRSVAEGYSIVIVDASPERTVAERLASDGALVFAQLEKGMGAGRRQVWRHANVLIRPDTQGSLWTEPEKPDIVRFIPAMISRMKEKKAKVIIPTRSTASWETYPGFQRASEQIANRVYNNLFQPEQLLDPMHGPVLFTLDALPAFIDFNPAAYGLPDTYVQHYVPPWYMRREGWKIAALEVDFVYPPQQKAEEETTQLGLMMEKRLDQLGKLVDAYFTIARETSR